MSDSKLQPKELLFLATVMADKNDGRKRSLSKSFKRMHKKMQMQKLREIVKECSILMW
jgi:hypothetical protein